jgi:hypothetical protein
MGMRSRKVALRRGTLKFSHTGGKWKYMDNSLQSRVIRRRSGIVRKDDPL